MKPKQWVATEVYSQGYLRSNCKEATLSSSSNRLLQISQFSFQHFPFIEILFF